MAAPLRPMLMAALHMWGEKEGSTPLGRSKDQVLGCKASWARQAVPHLPGMCAARAFSAVRAPVPPVSMRGGAAPSDPLLQKLPHDAELSKIGASPENQGTGSRAQVFWACPNFSRYLFSLVKGSTECIMKYNLLFTYFKDFLIEENLQIGKKNPM